MTIAELDAQTNPPKAGSDIAQPVFILCPARSFSSVVCSMIGQHPQLFGLPETNLFLTDTIGELLDMSTPPFGRRQSIVGVLRTLSYWGTGEQTEESIRDVNRWLKSRRNWTGADLYRYIQTLSAPRRCIDKSPTNTRQASLKRITQAFPDAHFLHLARHPRATCRSRHKAFSKRNQKQANRANHEQYWTSRHRLILEFAERLEPRQYMYIKGEALLAEPDWHLARIAEWLGVDTGREAIEAMKHPERSPFARVGPQNAKGGNNAGFMNDPTLRTGKLPDESLDGPLEWRQNSRGFGPNTVALAKQLGYE